MATRSFYLRGAVRSSGDRLLCMALMLFWPSSATAVPGEVGYSPYARVVRGQQCAVPLALCDPLLGRVVRRSRTLRTQGYDRAGDPRAPGASHLVLREHAAGPEPQRSLLLLHPPRAHADLRALLGQALGVSKRLRPGRDRIGMARALWHRDRARARGKPSLPSGVGATRRHRRQP